MTIAEGMAVRVWWSPTEAPGDVVAAFNEWAGSRVRSALAGVTSSLVDSGAAQAAEREAERAKERELVARMLRRDPADPAAWEEFLDRHRPRVLTFAQRMLRSCAEAEDVTQDVFERTVKGIGEFRGGALLRTWLYRITVNCCLRRLESGQRAGRHSGEDTLQSAIDPGPSPEGYVRNRELATALERAIGELEPVFRVAVLLSDVDGLSYDEIAEVLGVPLNTVKTRIHRGRQTLQKKLERLGV